MHKCTNISITGGAAEEAAAEDEGTEGGQSGEGAVRMAGQAQVVDGARNTGTAGKYLGIQGCDVSSCVSGRTKRINPIWICIWFGDTKFAIFP